jgi:hypothetical protein
MADDNSIENSLNKLFESELFKENNFIKIYNLLGIHNNVSNLSAPAPPAPAPPAPAPAPPAPAPAPAPPAPAPAPPAPAPPETTKAPAKAPAVAKAKRATEININKKGNDLVISGGFYKKDISIPNFYNGFSVSHKTTLSNIFSNIKNEDILNDYQDNIIIDPANIYTLSHNNGLTGQSGLSGKIYELLDDTTNTYKGFNSVKDLYTIDHTILYRNKLNQDAFYGEYKIKTDKIKTDKIKTDKIKTDNNKTIYIIHTIGPSFRDYINNTTINNDDYIKYLSYDTFNKIYDDILHIYNDNNKDKDKNKNLLLVPISSGLFATYTYNNIKTNITNEILTITAAIFINLYLKDQNVYMYIYKIKKGNTDDRNYKYFIAQINTIIGFIGFID